MILFPTLYSCNVELFAPCGFSVNYTLHFHSSIAFWKFY